MPVRPGDLLDFERPLLARGDVVVGIDEVGRGALAGPLTVGALVLRLATPPPLGLDDSKRLSPARRESLVAPLQNWAEDWSLGSASAEEIDVWGLRLALAVAATRAIEGLKVSPTHALIDGPFNILRSPGLVPFGPRAPDLHYGALPATMLVKGDSRSAVIAGASVLAKVNRDEYMVRLSEGFDGYDWSHNKGYGVPEHLEALRRLGPCHHHRMSWRLPELTVV